MSTPKISVVTPTLGQAEFIREAIESVLIQNYPNFEHIVYDGGSTDGTREILCEYPHLIWVSEPDRGQSDALNKALHRATGEIIAWLNSDDWYPPGVFQAIAPALSEYPVVMGACQMTDRTGHPTELTPNVKHSWYDILKYWVYDSIPCQPSIFFRRDALEKVRRADGVYIDPELKYVMDYDLWLRLSRLYPFDHTLDRTLSYYRIYGSNKTGGDWTPIFREASRVFARHAGDLTRNNIAFVRASNSTEQNKTQLQTDLLGQNAMILCVVEPGTSMINGFENRLLEVFQNDRIGIVELTSAGSPQYAPAVQRDDLGNLKVIDLIKDCRIFRNFAIRMVALLDLGMERFAQLLAEIPQALPVLALFKGWQIDSAPLLHLTNTQTEPTRTHLSRPEAKFIVDVTEELERDPFARIRSLHGFSVTFLPELVAEAQSVISQSNND